MREDSAWRLWVRSYATQLLLLILVVYLLITSGYNLLNPLFEAPDEHHHYFTAQYIAENGRLPIASISDKWLRQEAAQPPLYYLIGALLIAPIDTSDSREQIWFNPHANIGDPVALSNLNWVVHTSQETWPWAGYALAAHLLRGFSTLLGLGTLLSLYGSGRLLWSHQPENALLGTALAACLPQFNFLHGSITNDALIIMLSSATIWQLLRLWLTGISQGRLVWLGITVGLAALTKNAGVLLLIYAAAVLLLLWLRDHYQMGQASTDFRKLFTNLTLYFVPALLLVVWLWRRNSLLYGDFTAANQFIAFAGGDRAYSLWQVLGESGGLWPSLIAIFGWFNLRPPDWVYWVWNGLALIALAGVLKQIMKPRSKFLEGEQPQRLSLSQPWLVAAWVAVWFFCVYAGLAAFIMRTEAAQGRLLLPALLPLVLGLVYGLSRFRSRLIYIFLSLLALLTTLYCLFFVIVPAYALPPTINRLPPTAVSLNMAVGQDIELVGVDIETKTAVPGDTIWLTLYWQSNRVPTEDVRFVLELLGQNLEPVVQLDSYHGRGLYPAGLWSPGMIIADRFPVRLETTAVAPTLAAGYAGLAGEKERVFVGNVALKPAVWPEASEPTLVQLGDGIELTAVNLTTANAQPGETIQLDVQWHVLNAPQQTLTTLFHLGETGQPPLAVGDSQPLAGYYPTHLWQAAEVINDRYRLTIPVDLPDGRYPLWLGMYDSGNMTRLPMVAEGIRQPNDVYQVGWLKVQK